MPGQKIENIDQGMNESKNSVTKSIECKQH